PTNIESFFLVAQAGSLLAASENGGGSISTLSRHISNLEKQIGNNLFDRRSDGMALTETGTRLFQHAKRLHEAKFGFALAADGLDKSVRGTVRIAASTASAGEILSHSLARLADQEPGLSFEILATEKSANLLMGEADIALRSYEPQQSQLIAKRVGKHTIGLYASQYYLARHGQPKALVDLQEHSLIGDDANAEFYDSLAAAGFPIGREGFRFRTDNKLAAWSFLVRGCGIGLAPVGIEDAETELMQVLAKEASFDIPLWLVAGPNLRTNARTRRVFDFLSLEFAKL
ncbi:MAG: LysR family transcriptional regulator, partial [Pseudomonadota bacterium]